MKNLLLFFVLFIFTSISINSQNRNEKIKECNINSTDKYSMSIKKYNGKNKFNGNLFKPIKATSDYYKYTYTYDNSGNCLMELQENWTDNIWVNKTKRTYTYDNLGNCLTEIVEGWSNGTWLNNWRYSYTYDNSGNCLTKFEEDGLSGI